MSLYVMGDLHLGFAVNKPMDVFGGGWRNYVERIREGFSAVEPGDTVVLLGDLSWGSGLAQSAEDFRFIASLPGRKIMVKGNHDYYWTTAAKLRKFFDENGLKTAEILHNNALLHGKTALAGTRGWFYEEERGGAFDAKIFNRELGRLKTSLTAAAKLGAEETICFLHYPPLYEGYRCDEIVAMMTEYGVKRCFYAHLHGKSHDRAIEGDYRGIEYKLVSGDYLGFKPYRIEV